MYKCNPVILLFNVPVFSNGRLEAAMQRLTNLCSVLNDMEPICVLNHVFVLREVRVHLYLLKKIIFCSAMNCNGSQYLVKLLYVLVTVAIGV